MSDDLVKNLRTVSNMINMGEKIRWGEETNLMDEAANRIEADQELIQEMRGALHGPYGWLTGNIGLNEEYWTVEADEVKDGEFFSIPLYAKVDPIALAKAKSQQEGETE